MPRKAQQRQNGVVKALILVAVLLLSNFVSYLYGGSVKDSEYKSLAAEASKAAKEQQEKLQKKLDDISYVFFKTSNTEQARITSLQRQLRNKPDTIECTQDDRGNTIAIIPDVDIRLLTEASDYKALSNTTDKSCSIDTPGAVTARNLSTYTICIIGRYNRVGSQLDGLINSVAKFKQAQKNSQP